MKDYNCSITLVHWKGHDLNCATCTMYQDKRKGGRPPKQPKNRGRPKGNGTNSRVELKAQLKRAAGPKYTAEVPISPSRFPSDSVQELIWSVCGNVADQAVEINCGHMVCALCCSAWLDESSSTTCPTCHSQISGANGIKAVSPIVLNIMSQLNVHCDNQPLGCHSVVPLKQLESHVVACHPPYACPQPTTTNSGATPAPLTPSKVASILAQPPDQPLNETEERCTVSFLRRLTFQQGRNLEIRTGGQVHVQTWLLHNYL